MGELGSAAEAKFSARSVFIVQLGHGCVLSPRGHFDKRKRFKAGGLLILAASFQPVIVQGKSSGHATHGMGSTEGHGFGPKLFRDRSVSQACAAPGIQAFSNVGKIRVWAWQGLVFHGLILLQCVTVSPLYLPPPQSSRTLAERTLSERRKPRFHLHPQTPLAGEGPCRGWRRSYKTRARPPASL